MTSLKVLGGGAVGAVFGQVLWEGGKCFFDRVTILFHQCNNTTIAYQQFYSDLRYCFILSLYFYLTMCFSIPLKITLWTLIGLPRPSHS